MATGLAAAALCRSCAAKCWTCSVLWSRSLPSRCVSFCSPACVVGWECACVWVSTATLGLAVGLATGLAAAALCRSCAAQCWTCSALGSRSLPSRCVSFCSPACVGGCGCVCVWVFVFGGRDALHARLHGNAGVGTGAGSSSTLPLLRSEVLDLLITVVTEQVCVSTALCVFKSLSLSLYIYLCVCVYLWLT